ncbi:hypothetical protein E2C01_050129 [Portunus trituberculatus]|uniref:Uncharacterized protein n=1 Tax=Portunus trituberculatus TaxID=210409 RepID=A0A5B7GFV3_PORTR|nr:hypothetical protein [Portunus trituberculatus]
MSDSGYMWSRPEEKARGGVWGRCPDPDIGPMSLPFLRVCVFLWASGCPLDTYSTDSKRPKSFTIDGLYGQGRGGCVPWAEPGNSRQPIYKTRARVNIRSYAHTPGGTLPDALLATAAQQVQSFLISSPALEPSVSSRLITHLSSCASAMSGVNTSGPTQAGPPTPSATSPSAPPVGVPNPRPISAPAPSRHVMVPAASPPMSPPPLMDLSMKPAPKLVAPTPIREINVPQDLSMRRPPSRESREQSDQHPEGRSSWRPW